MADAPHRRWPLVGDRGTLEKPLGKLSPMASTPPALLAITDFPEQRLASAAESFGRESPMAGDALADTRRAKIF
jgi:hypothetical protein